MRHQCYTLLAILPILLLSGCSSRATAPPTVVEGVPPAARVERCLDRAVTMTSFLQTFPWALKQWQANRQLVGELQPALVGRAALVWGWEDGMVRGFSSLSRRVAQVHEQAPDVVLQGCIFEFVSRAVEGVSVPEDVQLAFGLEPESRNYDYDAMLPSQAPPHIYQGWGIDAAVPDITRPETQLWFFHLATIYLDAGLEAIHLGNIARITAHDPDLQATEDLLLRIRAYAATHARRGWVILDAHTHGLVRDDRLLLDFHSWPMRLREVGDPELEDVVIEEGFLDGIYGRSRGGTTPGGDRVQSQRFLVELDNGYAGNVDSGCDRPECVWGRDEITWFAQQPHDRRNELLRRFWVRVPELDPVGRFQVPAVRPLQSLLITGCDRYLLHRPEDLGCGAGQLDTVIEMWGPPPGP